MDAEPLRALSRLPATAWRCRGVQRQVHVFADGAARRQLRHATRPHPRQLPQFLSARRALAVQRAAARQEPDMIDPDTVVAPPNATIVDLSPDLQGMQDAAIDGLSMSPKWLPAWLFYDARGSELFEAICEQPEYYPTRTELAILQQHGHEIAETLGAGCRLVELGSGADTKARKLLRILENPDGYVAIDISSSQLRASVLGLAREFPRLPITGIVADYGEDSALPLEESPGNGPLVGFFPGSTIGNMEPRVAESFLSAWAERLSGGGMLVGVDLLKSPQRLNAAYNDAAGITAEFNLNMLRHINRELGTDFDLSRFQHRAFFNA